MVAQGPVPPSPPTTRGQRTDTAFQEAARRVISRKGFLKTTMADIAEEAERSVASFYNYYDSKEALLEVWAEQFRQNAIERARPAYHHGADPSEVILESVRAHWATYKEHLAEMVGVFQAAMLDDGFAHRWREIRSEAIETIANGVRRAQRAGFAPGMDPLLTASALAAMMNQFCYIWLAQEGDARERDLDEEEAIHTLATIWYRSVYWKPGGAVAEPSGGPRV